MYPRTQLRKPAGMMKRGSTRRTGESPFAVEDHLLIADAVLDRPHPGKPICEESPAA
jgi:hypothetical protein